MSDKPLPESISLSEAVRHDYTPAPDVETLEFDLQREIIAYGIQSAQTADGVLVGGGKVSRVIKALILAAEARGRNETQHELTELYDTEVVRRRTLETSLTEQAETIRQLREELSAMHVRHPENACADMFPKLRAQLAKADAQSPAAVRATLEGLKEWARSSGRTVCLRTHRNRDRSATGRAPQGELSVWHYRHTFQVNLKIYNF